MIWNLIRIVSKKKIKQILSDLKVWIERRVDGSKPHGEICQQTQETLPVAQESLPAQAPEPLIIQELQPTPEPTEEQEQPKTEEAVSTPEPPIPTIKSKAKRKTAKKKTAKKH